MSDSGAQQPVAVPALSSASSGGHKIAAAAFPLQGLVGAGPKVAPHNVSPGECWGLCVRRVRSSCEEACVQQRAGVQAAGWHQLLNCLWNPPPRGPLQGASFSFWWEMDGEGQKEDLH